MRRFIQVFALLVLALAIRPAGAFSLLGPLGEAPGGEAWQTVELGYSVNAAIGSPKNLTHEYRWSKPVITYAFDPTFVNYFGSNGVAAVEAAIAVFNSLPNVSTLTQSLDEYPLEDPTTGATTTFRDSRRINYQAQALDLLDMKSITMGLLTEQLGLASPERWVWALRARETVGPLPITNYFTIMRNFDPVTLTPSRYVNGNRYTYEIFELEPPFQVHPMERTVDPESALYSDSSVANIMDGDPGGLERGVYYTYLTRDDIGGLRYIYDTNNLQYESFAPGTQISAVDLNALTIVTNQDLASFSSFTLLNDRATVQAAFPNLVILTNWSFLGTNVEVVAIVETNVRPPWGNPFTSNFTLVPIFETNLVINYGYAFQNVVTNFASASTVIQVEESGFEEEPWSTPQNPIYKTNIFDVTITNLPSGGIIIVPTNVGQYQFTGIQRTNIITITNSLFETNVLDRGLIRPLRQVEFYTFTNVQFAAFPFVLQDAPASVLRGGVGKISFQRLDTAIFTGTNFIHTNTFFASYFTNGTFVENVFTIAQNQPDIVFGAADLGTVGVVPVTVERNAGFVSNAALNSSLDPATLGGPGNIFGPINITYNNVGPGYLNTRPGTATEEAALDEGGTTYVWGFFDGGTNAPVVFPKDITLEDIEFLITGGLEN